MGRIKRRHTVKFIALVYDRSRVDARVWINTLTFSHFVILSLRTGDYIESKITVNQFCAWCNWPGNYNQRLTFSRTDFIHSEHVTYISTQTEAQKGTGSLVYCTIHAQFSNTHVLEFL